jgi:hypothetical protein
MDTVIKAMMQQMVHNHLKSQATSINEYTLSVNGHCDQNHDATLHAPKPIKLEDNTQVPPDDKKEERRNELWPVKPDNEENDKPTAHEEGRMGHNHLKSQATSINEYTLSVNGHCDQNHDATLHAPKPIKLEDNTQVPPEDNKEERRNELWPVKPDNEDKMNLTALEDGLVHTHLTSEATINNEVTLSFKEYGDQSHEIDSHEGPQETTNLSSEVHNEDNNEPQLEATHAT